MRSHQLFAALPFIAAFCLAGPVEAQEIAISLGQDGSISARTIQLILLITVLSLAPGLAIMITCFPFIVTVLSILRQGIGLQQSPPNMLIVSLALFLTYYVMEPVFSEAWASGVAPLLDESIEVEEAAQLALAPFRDFMAGRVDNATFSSMANLRPDTTGMMATPDAPL